MSKVNNLGDFLTDIANAIREKKGTSATINAQDFSREIASIESGDSSDAEEMLKGIIERSQKNIVVPNGTKRISSYLCYYDSNVKTIIIPNSVTEIGVHVCEYCPSMDSITIGDGVVNIGDNSFSACTYARNVTIGSGITQIGRSCFSHFSQLSSFTCEAVTPPTIQSNTFDYTKDTRTFKVYVPAESVEAYKSATNWSSFANKIYPKR